MPAKLTKTEQKLQQMYEGQIATMQTAFDGLYDKLKAEVAENQRLNDELIALRREVQVAMGARA